MGVNNCLTFEDLVKLTGYNRRSDLAACLDRNNIRYFDGKDGIWTTLELINAAKGLYSSLVGQDGSEDKKDLI